MKNRLLIISTLIFLILGCTTDKKTSREMLEIDPSLTTGVLDNGLTYFIQENEKPENRIELRLIVNAGSMQENDNQKGLAHFVEHMAFNGTESFPKGELIKYLESLGMGFGPEINAYTSFDETVYKLSVPADDPEAIENAFLVLEEWAHKVSFEDEEIEKERGVIVEEWRGGRGVQGRFMDRLLPVLMKDSRYAERLTIGDMEVVKNCDPQLLRDYYNEWYRPELISVAVVGEIKTEEAERLVHKYFNYEDDNQGRERVVYDSPILDRVDVEIIEDPEKTSSEVLYILKDKAVLSDSYERYKDEIEQLLGIVMFNSRMEEIYTKPGADFLYAGSGYANFIRDTSMVLFSAQVEDDKVEAGFKALLTEIEKVKQHGFNPDELDRALALLEMYFTNIYNERENIESASKIEQITGYFLEGSPVLDPEYDYSLIMRMIDEITFEDVNSEVDAVFARTDRTIVAHVPENSEIEQPSEDRLTELFDEVSTVEYEKRAIDNSSNTLFDYSITPGEVISVEEVEEFGITEVVLANGAKVVLKPTDFKDDEIQFLASSFGGTSYVEDDELFSGRLADSLVEGSGLNGFDSIELDKLLTGKNVAVSPWISDYTEGFYGGSNIKESETLFQLINLYFTNPEFSEEYYEVLMNNVISSIKNRENDPGTIYRDKVTSILRDDHFRSRPITMESLEDVDLAEIEEIYLERFANPGDFIYVFTGNIDVDEFIELASLYIGSIPGSGNREEPKDVGLRYTDGIHEEVVNRGIEEKSSVQIIFTGDFNGTAEDEFALTLLDSYLEEQLRLKIREDLGGTYGIGIRTSIELYPYKEYSLSVIFGCEPDRVDELTGEVFDLLDRVKDGEIDNEGVEAVKTNFIRGLELDLKENGYWLSSILNVNMLNRDYDNITDDDLSNITPEKFVELTNEYFNENRYIKAVLKPE